MTVGKLCDTLIDIEDRLINYNDYLDGSFTYGRDRYDESIVFCYEDNGDLYLLNELLPWKADDVLKITYKLGDEIENRYVHFTFVNNDHLYIYLPDRIPTDQISAEIGGKDFYSDASLVLSCLSKIRQGESVEDVYQDYIKFKSLKY